MQSSRQHSGKYGAKVAMRRAAALAVALSAFTAFGVFAQVEQDVLAATPVDELKRVYMDCDRAASRTVLDFGTAAQCSMVGESLMKRAFAGDFDKLLAWWRIEKDAAPHNSASADTARRSATRGSH